MGRGWQGQGGLPRAVAQRPSRKSKRSSRGSQEQICGERGERMWEWLVESFGRGQYDPIPVISIVITILYIHNTFSTHTLTYIQYYSMCIIISYPSIIKYPSIRFWFIKETDRRCSNRGVTRYTFSEDCSTVPQRHSGHSGYGMQWLQHCARVRDCGWTRVQTLEIESRFPSQLVTGC